MKNAVVIMSGGIDSTVASYYLKGRLEYDTIKFLLFDYGQRALKEEEFCCRENARKLNAEFKKIELSWLGDISASVINQEKNFQETTEKDLEDEHKDITPWWVPCRNAVFLINALAYAESEFIKTNENQDVVIGLINEGRVHMKDTTEKFIRKVNDLAKESTDKGEFKILAPLIKMDKTEVIKLGQELKVPFGLTYSCYIGNRFQNNSLMHCGKCLSCMLRKKGFYWAGVEDSTFYKQ
ncbi:7-cyano-7-deazaguanine synthase [Candidatus Woesearchaeota archaeon]|nr:7-cyano-7-deazaguanine synthase [Candidatus Woesearchaeota archaeon]